MGFLDIGVSFLMTIELLGWLPPKIICGKRFSALCNSI